MAEIIKLTADTPSVRYLCGKDKRLAKVFHMIGPISYETHADDPFPFLIHEIIEQMLSIKAGIKIYGRLETLCGGRVTPSSIAGLSADEIRSIGTSMRKAQNIKGAAEAVMDGRIDFSRFPDMTDDEVLQELTSLPGIGTWTAKMYLIFILDRQDILPYEDVSFLQGYKWAYKTKDVSKEAVMKKCRKWKPCSSIAARYLYRARDLGLTKKEFHLFK